jgi:MFS transporter, FHS family, L-fucose permease
VIMGRVSDVSNIQTSYIVPALCFIVVFFFALKNGKVKSVKMGASH